MVGFDMARRQRSTYVPAVWEPKDKNVQKLVWMNARLLRQARLHYDVRCRSRKEDIRMFLGVLKQGLHTKKLRRFVVRAVQYGVGGCKQAAQVQVALRARAKADKAAAIAAAAAIDAAAATAAAAAIDAAAATAAAAGVPLAAGGSVHGASSSTWCQEQYTVPEARG